jgi:hypothetical protein
LEVSPDEVKLAINNIQVITIETNFCSSMTKPTLQQVFGSNASQDATSVTISKADLTSVGLVAGANNTAESLLVALILKAAAYLSPTNQDSNPDIQVTVEQSTFPSIVVRNNQNYRQTTFNVNLQTIDVNSAVNPNNY